RAGARPWRQASSNALISASQRAQGGLFSRVRSSGSENLLRGIRRSLASQPIAEVVGSPSGDCGAAGGVAAAPGTPSTPPAAGGGVGNAAGPGEGACLHLPEKRGGGPPPQMPQAAILPGLPAKHAVSAPKKSDTPKTVHPHRAEPLTAARGRTGIPRTPPPRGSRPAAGHRPGIPYPSSTSDHLCNMVSRSGSGRSREPSRTLLILLGSRDLPPGTALRPQPLELSADTFPQPAHGALGAAQLGADLLSRAALQAQF